MPQLEGVQPEDQGLNVADDIFNVVLQESQRPQTTGRDRLRLNRRLARRLAKGRLHAGGSPSLA